MLVTVDVVGIYLKISHDLELQSLRETLNETGICKVPMKRLFQWQSFFSKTTTLKLIKKVCKQISETAIETKF